MAGRVETKKIEVEVEAIPNSFDLISDTIRKISHHIINLSLVNIDR